MQAAEVIRLLELFERAGMRVWVPGLNGPGFEYPADGFASGSIDGRSVRCLSVE